MHSLATRQRSWAVCATGTHNEFATQTELNENVPSRSLHMVFDEICVLPNRACSCMHAIITSSLSFSVSGTMCSYFGREALIEIISSAALDRD